MKKELFDHCSLTQPLLRKVSWSQSQILLKIALNVPLWCWIFVAPMQAHLIQF